EYEKKEIIDTNQIAALIDKAKEVEAVKEKQKSKITQSSQKNSFATGLSLSEEDALKAQIFGCWSIPLGLPYNENLLVRIKLQLNPDGTVSQSEILDHARMNKPGQGFYKVLAESALRAVKLCQPLRVPTTGYERWKELQLNFDAREMLEG
ncbi:MAG: cell envelope biogenesis protein TolA, partial [Pelagibacteraceae bacterium]